MERIKQLQQARVEAKEAGFTLVELAIVLVIIGLIVGGVLVGQDLIKAAEIRATTTDLERYNAAANTFRNKYNGIPGDLLSARATQFGLESRDGAAANGDGNGLVEGCAAATVDLGCETAMFWTDLTVASLIPDAFTTYASGGSGAAATVTATGVAGISDYLPSAPLRDNAYISVYPQGGRNYYMIASFSGVAAGEQAFSAAGVQALSMLEASQIDDKIDDGKPQTGIVRAVDIDAGAEDGFGAARNQGAVWDPGVSTIDPADPTTAVATACVDDGTISLGGAVYYVSHPDVASTLNCAISIRSSF